MDKVVLEKNKCKRDSEELKLIFLLLRTSVGYNHKNINPIKVHVSEELKLIFLLLRTSVAYHHKNINPIKVDVSTT